MEDKEDPIEASIDIKLFNAATAKYINAQKLKFVNKDTTSLATSQGSRRLAQKSNTSITTKQEKTNGFRLENRCIMSPRFYKPY